MTNDQLLGLVRQLLPIIGGVAVTLGWITKGQLSQFIELAAQIGGPALIVGSAIWAAIANSKTSILKSAANMPEVKEVTLDKSAPETQALSDATPANVVAK